MLVRVRPWPLELVNGEPLDPAFVAEEVAELRGSVAPDLFDGFRADRFPRTTLPALHLTEAAYAVGPASGEAVALELRDRLFERGEAIDDPSILARVAHDHQIDPQVHQDADPVLVALAEGRARGVVGSPHFFRSDEGWFCPALDVRRVDERLVITADEAAFEGFLDRCLAGA